MKNILQNSTKTLNTAALTAVIFASITSRAADQPISPADQEYFEAKIRPISHSTIGCIGEGRLPMKCGRDITSSILSTISIIGQKIKVPNGLI